MGHSGICRYCGGKIRVVPAEQIYGKAAAERLNLQTEYIHQCQNCNARVGCHKGRRFAYILYQSGSCPRYGGYFAS